MTEIIAAKEHAVLGPSGWDRWSACPGSVVLEEQFPNVASIYAAEGSVAHEIAARCLTDNADAEDFVGRMFHIQSRDQRAPGLELVGYHEIVVDMEMADAVNDYVATVRSFIGEDDILLVEQAVPIGHLTGETGAEGTADVIGICADGTRLVVIDFKYGKGVQVWASMWTAALADAQEDKLRINGQGGMYGNGGLEKFGLIHEDIAEVEIVIVQPRLDHVDSVTVSVDQLREFGEEVTLAAGLVQIARSEMYGIGHDYLHPGEKQCKFCRAKSVCPALAAEVSSSMALVSAADPKEFADLTLPKQAASVVVDAETQTEKLASFMRAAPLMEEAIKAVRAEVERRLLAGDEAMRKAGWKLVQGKKGNRQWKEGEFALDEKKPDEKITIEEALKKRLGAKLAYVKKLISVTEAEKLFKAKPRTWAKIAPLITQADGKPSVAPESDPRPPMRLGADPEDFPDLTVEDEIQAPFGLPTGALEEGLTAADLFGDD